MDQKQAIVVALLPPPLPLLNVIDSPPHHIGQIKFNHLAEQINMNVEVKQPINKESYTVDQKMQLGYLVYENTIPQVWKNSINSINQIQKSHFPQCPQQDTLIFSSNFESGNLKYAYKIQNSNIYNLQMSKDINTYGYTQWFYFKIQKAKVDTTYKFNIINFYKKRSLFRQGMKILVYSTKSRQGWTRSGSNIKYFKNGKRQYRNKSIVKTYYTLSFSYQFVFQEDSVYFAYNYPYTYSRLNQLLNNLKNSNSEIFKKHCLCKTLVNNKVDMVTITNPKSNAKKKTIFIIARTHPGQTVSSFAIEGTMRYLTSKDADKLRELFIFKIVPMINPDGVIHGHYRTSLSGQDLNRKWEYPNQTMNCEVFKLKKYIQQYKKNNQIIAFCDLHGHSQKKNIFAYGCNNEKAPYKSRQFAYLLQKHCKFFSYEDSTFGISSSKRQTARAIMKKLLPEADVLTIEISFCGPNRQDFHFNIGDLLNFGMQFCQTIDTMYTREEVKTDMLKGLYTQPIKQNCCEDESDSEASIDIIRNDKKKMQPVTNYVKLTDLTKKIQSKRQKLLKNEMKKFSLKSNKTNSKSPTSNMVRIQNRRFFNKRKFSRQESVHLAKTIINASYTGELIIKNKQIRQRQFKRPITPIKPLKKQHNSMNMTNRVLQSHSFNFDDTCLRRQMTHIMRLKTEGQFSKRVITLDLKNLIHNRRFY